MKPCIMVGKDSTRQALAGKTGGKITDHMVMRNQTNEKAKINNKKDINANSPKSLSQNVTMPEMTGLEEVMRLLHALTSDVQEIKRDYNSIKDAMDRSFASNEEWKGKMMHLEEENELLKNRILRLEKRDETRERENKRNNVIIRGLDVHADEAQKVTEDFLSDEFGIHAGIKEIKPFVRANKTTFIIVKFENGKTKKELMQKKKKLAGSYISINHDTTFEEREIQRRILQIAKEREQQGATVKVAYRKLWINETLFTWKDGEGLVENFRRRSGAYTQSTQASQHN